MEISERHLIGLITEHFINLIEELYILKNEINDEHKAITEYIFDNLKSNLKLFEKEFGKLDKNYFLKWVLHHLIST